MTAEIVSYFMPFLTMIFIFRVFACNGSSHVLISKLFLLIFSMIEFDLFNRINCDQFTFIDLSDI